MIELLKSLLKKYPGDRSYWNTRYSRGGNSGSGSYDRLAEFKIQIINDFIAQEKIKSIIDFGCGDGNQIALISVRKYLGIDISQIAISLCQDKYSERKEFSFLKYDPEIFDAKSNLSCCSISLDVIFHITKDQDYFLYLTNLFAAAEKYVIIYSRNKILERNNHVMDREFLNNVYDKFPDWVLYKYIPNKFPFDHGNPDLTSRSDFFIFKRTTF